MSNEPRPEDIAKLLEELAKRTPQFIASLGAMAVGVWAMIDDRKDLGKLGHERNPPLPHHWLLGVLSFLGGLAGLGVTMLDLFIALSPVKLSAQDIEKLMEVPKRIEIATKPSPWNQLPISELEALR